MERLLQHCRAILEAKNSGIAVDPLYTLGASQRATYLERLLKADADGTLIYYDDESIITTDDP